MTCGDRSIAFFKHTNHSVRDHCRKEKLDDQVSRSRARGQIQSTNLHTKSKRISNREVDQLCNVGHVVASAKLSQFDTQLYMFEDNEAVIKMIIKGRSPTMRHVSRSHRVALDWLFDRIHWDRKIQIKSVDTKKQLADMLTKDNLTRDEWSYLLRLINIMNFSMFSCSLKSRTPCRRELRREGQEKNLW